MDPATLIGLVIACIVTYIQEFVLRLALGPELAVQLRERLTIAELFPLGPVLTNDGVIRRERIFHGIAGHSVLEGDSEST